MPKRNFSQTGFTLIELLVTVAILGIILAIAVPNFTSWYQRKKLEGIASDFVALVNYARTESIKRNVKIYLITERTNDSSWSLRAATTNTCTAGTSTCELMAISPAQYSKYRVTALSSDFSSGATEINPIDNMLKFNGGSTTTQSANFAFGDFELQARVTMTGVTSLCVPATKPAMPGYTTCS